MISGRALGPMGDPQLARRAALEGLAKHPPRLLNRVSGLKGTA